MLIIYWYFISATGLSTRFSCPTRAVSTPCIPCSLAWGLSARFDDFVFEAYPPHTGTVNTQFGRHPRFGINERLCGRRNISRWFHDSRLFTGGSWERILAGQKSLARAFTVCAMGLRTQVPGLYIHAWYTRIHMHLYENRDTHKQTHTLRAYIHTSISKHVKANKTENAVSQGVGFNGGALPIDGNWKGASIIRYYNFVFQKF